MEVDVGCIAESSGTASYYSGTIVSHPGTTSYNPGTAQWISDNVMSEQPMEIDEPLFPARPVLEWAQPIMTYLLEDTLPDNEVEARQVFRRAKAYTVINTELYKRSVTEILQRCVGPEEGGEMLLEIHQGECAHHTSSRALVAKAFWHGFYWPSALQQVEDIVRKCEGCQRFAHRIHVPASALKTIPITWLFAVWCLDMVGQFKKARGNMTRISVMVDKFMK